ncbi:UDP-galactopyranose mutase [Ruminococcaceae bacterium YRB3002]|nr:UDP-galactopyranose mutase [Ruminococcaceae bacterium YRB3002]
MSKYDYLIVGAGLYGAAFARIAADDGKTCLVIDRRENIGGNCFTENVHGINVHKYGAHIFHTDDEKVWKFAQRFAEFNRYTNTVIANYKGEVYSLPFNMYTFNKMWGVITPEEAEAKLQSQREEAGIKEPQNLEEQAISLIGRDIYEKLVKGYTEKQWGRKATELPAFIIKRLPVRLTYDNNYFNDRFQGIPIGGYTQWIANMLEGIEVRCGVDYLQNREELDALADKVIYTGMIDEFYGFKLGCLEYRSLRFETEYMADRSDYQGNAVVNYTDAETPYTRIIEHKHFEFGKGEGTVVTKEYPAEWKPGDEPYYPMNNDRNNSLYEEYTKLGEGGKVFFGGRLGKYKYYDMDDTIACAMADYAIMPCVRK